MSNPAKTVNRLSGVDPFDNDIITPGLAFFAAQPQTEFTTIKEVPDLDKALLTSSDVVSSENPEFVNSSLNGFTISSGYIFFFLQIYEEYLLLILD